MSRPGWSRILFAAGIIGMGILGLVYGKSAVLWQPVPRWAPGREGVVYVCGVLMFLGGVGLLFARAVKFASAVLSIYLLLWLILVKAPKVAMDPFAIVPWETFGETAAMLSGAWILFVSRAGDVRYRHSRLAAGVNGVNAVRGLFGVALFLFGLSHFGYAQFTAALVPAWLPWHLGWVYLTGICYIAAGVGIVFRIFPRLAAALSAVMMSVFTLLIWVPGVAVMPTDENQWTELLISWTLAASTWVVADSYRDIPWFALPYGKAKLNPLIRDTQA